MIGMLRDFAIGISIVYGLHFLMLVLSKSSVFRRSRSVYSRRRIKTKRQLASPNLENS